MFSFNFESNWIEIREVEKSIFSLWVEETRCQKFILQQEVEKQKTLQ
jgi:hypothetical protein